MFLRGGGEVDDGDDGDVFDDRSFFPGVMVTKKIFATRVIIIVILS